MDKPTIKPKKKFDMYVVGVGASAGGLDALSKFLKNFNGVQADVCIVIVMHLSPDYKSQLASILDKRCRWPVISAENDMPLSSGKIYVTPQNKQIRIHDNELVLEDLSPQHAFTPSIDNFLKSLAKDKGKKAVGIILSGFGKDGSQGISAIREQGGFTIAQLPETAEHRDMPHFAIQTGHVDLTIPAGQMYDKIVQYISNSKTIATSTTNDTSIDAIFELLEKRSGTDFSMYKPSTIMRRINHRINFLQLGSIVQYYELIKENPIELDNLFDTVLIGVTEFFRDLEAFDLLKRQLKNMLKDKEPGDSIRIWSVGCATGEEPYSIAILLHELLGNAASQYHIQIFASDIDERALNFGRNAVYHKEILGNVPVEIINKYFDKQDDLHYELKKEIKQHVLFTRHDITNDPPFVKLDLVVCRNLLIYFNNTLQKQSFQIFHYALKPQGLLFLGKSESVSVASDLFKKIGNSKIFRKADASLSYQLKFSRYRSKNKESKEEEGKNNIRNMSIADVAKETLYYKYDNPFVIVNEHSEIKEVHGSLRLYLEISEGTMNVNIHKMVNTELVTVVKAVTAQVKKTGVTHTSHVVKFKLYDQLHYVRIKIIPLVYRISEMQYFMIIFEKVEPSEGHLELQKKLETSDFVNIRIKELEDELASTKEHLQIFTEELEATNEELQTINEELQSSNEELKSSNEELETSNEELQSANEELNTANQELRLTNDLLLEKERELKDEKETSQRNEEIYKTLADNIPNGAVGILNKDFIIEYIGGKGINDFNAKDLIGKYMPTLNPSKKEIKRIGTLCNNTLKSGKSGHIEIQYKHRYYDIKTVPFKMPFDNTDKILYLSQEITHNKLNQFMLEQAIKVSNLVVYEYNYVNDQITANKQLSKLLDVDPETKITKELIDSKIHKDDLIFRQKDLKKALKTGVVNHEVRLKQKNGYTNVRISGRILFGANNKPLKAYKTILDISKDKKLVEQAQKSEKRFRTLAENAPMIIWITDKNGNCTYINKTWLEYTGSTLEENLGDGWLNFLHEDDKERSYKIYIESFKKREPYINEYRIKNKNGEYHWFLSNGIPRFDSTGNFDGFVGSNSDIESQKEIAKALEHKIKQRTKEITKANEELIKLNMNLEEFAYVASHDLKEPLRKIRTFNSLIGNAPLDTKTIEDYSDKIEKSAERLTDLIDDILVYTSIEKNSIRKEKLDLDHKFKSVLNDLSLLIEENNVSIEKKGTLGEIMGVNTRVYQLFSNFIRNAIKFNKNIPKISVSSELVKGSELNKNLGADPNQVYKKLTFKDNGIGIDITKKDYIFKPFKRLNASSEYSGTGVGLAICKRIMIMHDGFIDLESKKGKGSSFMVYFPVSH